VRATLVLAACLSLPAVLPMLFPRAARAAEPAEVENLIRQGVELRQQGRDHAALPLFQRAYDLEHTPRTAAQLGVVEASMGYWLAAERHLVEALAAPRHPFVAKNSDQLQQTLLAVRGGIGEIDIQGTPAGAEISVNGKSEGVLPLSKPLRANEGIAQIAITSPGFEEKRTSLQVVGGKKHRLNVALVPSAATTAARSEAGAPRAGKTGRTARTGVTAESQPPEPGSSSGAPAWVRPLSWVGAGLAAVGIGVGAYGVSVLRSKGQEFNDHRIAGQRDCSESAANKGGSACKTIYEEAVAGQRLAINGFAAGGLLATAAIVGFLWSSGPEHPSTDAAAASSGAVASIDSQGFYAGWRASF
jgi:hypothetical protein